jgi:hypothetical protein
MSDSMLVSCLLEASEEAQSKTMVSHNFGTAKATQQLNKVTVDTSNDI